MTNPFDRAVSYYDETRSYLPGVADRIGQALLEAAAATAETRILDLGVGASLSALSIIRASQRYAGVDISPRILDVLRDKPRDLPGASDAAG